MVKWLNGAMVQWCNGEMVEWWNGEMASWLTSSSRPVWVLLVVPLKAMCSRKCATPLFAAFSYLRCRWRCKWRCKCRSHIY